VFGRAKAFDGMHLDQGLDLRFRNALLITFGQDGLWRNAVNPNAEGTHLSRDGLREDLYARLCRRVWNRRVGMGPAARGRRNSDDIAGFALFHPRQHAFNGEKRSGEISLDRCMPACLVCLLDRPRRSEASPRVGYEDVERSQTLLDLTAHGFDFGELGDIGSE